jgi:23S rRNA (uracil1939-C5)-methyltransferase
VFVPFALPGESILARQSDGRAEIETVLEASPDRVPPPCPHFGVCGGCALQHWAAAPYLRWKAEQIRLALARERIETQIAPAIPVEAGARRRLALHARKDRAGAIVLGFKSRRSWQVMPIGTCVVAAPELVTALPALARLAEPFLEHPLSAPTLHVTSTLTGIDVDVTGVERRGSGLSADARTLAARLAAEADLARLTLAGETLYQSRPPLVRFGSASLALPAGAFLQACAAAEAAMARVVIDACAGAHAVADLFCGVGTFTLRLAARTPVLALDNSREAIGALSSAFAHASGLKPVEALARDLERRPLGARELERVEAAVFDPPRAGAAAQAAQLAAARLDRVVAVSCNPATFARDAAILVGGGFVLESVQPVDQFLWSPHIELVGVFGRLGP